jgi:MHS family proline/betaine transporter-like MFS transporter
MALSLPVLIGSGLLADCYGRRPLTVGGDDAWIDRSSAGVLATAPSIVPTGADRTAPARVDGGLLCGVQPSIMVKAVPAQVRCTAATLGYDITLGVIGGTTPLAATWLGRTHGQRPPAYLIMAAVLVTTAAIWRLRETHRAPFVSPAGARIA